MGPRVHDSLSGLPKVDLAREKLLAEILRAAPATAWSPRPTTCRRRPGAGAGGGVPWSVSGRAGLPRPGPGPFVQLFSESTGRVSWRCPDRGTAVHRHVHGPCLPWRKLGVVDPESVPGDPGRRTLAGRAGEPGKRPAGPVRLRCGVGLGPTTHLQWLMIESTPRSSKPNATRVVCHRCGRAVPVTGSPRPDALARRWNLTEFTCSPGEPPDPSRTGTRQRLNRSLRRSAVLLRPVTRYV